VNDTYLMGLQGASVDRAQYDSAYRAAAEADAKRLKNSNARTTDRYGPQAHIRVHIVFPAAQKRQGYRPLT
jgi:hypothetical protein